MIGQQIHQQGNERCFEDKASHLIFPWGNLKAENHDVKSLESKKNRKKGKQIAHLREKLLKSIKVKSGYPPEAGLAFEDCSTMMRSF